MNQDKPLCGKASRQIHLASLMRNQLYIKIGGEDRYWYRAVDKQGNTVDFLLTAKRDARAARRFFTRAVKNSRLLEIVNIDKSGANKAGIREYNAKHGTKVMIRQCKCLNNIVEQDHRAVKRFTRPIQGFKDLRLRGSFWVASSLCTCPQRADARRRERSVEQDHRAVKRFTRPIQGFKDLRLRGSFWVASSLCTCPQRADARRRERSHV